VTRTAELIALRANLRAQYDAADRWLEQAAADPKLKPDQLQVLHVRRMALAYTAFKTKLDALEAIR
jgi:hypothetical protein